MTAPSTSLPQPRRRHRRPPLHAGTPAPARSSARAPAADACDDPQRILDAAQASFFAHGFHTVTMADLARDLGMSKKTLYRHFPDKESLLGAVLERFADSVAGVFHHPRGTAPRSAAAQLRDVGAGLSERLATLQPAFLLSLKRFAPLQFERLQHLRRRNLENHLLPLLQRGQRQGEIRRDLDAAFAVEILIQTVHGLLDPEVLRRLQRTPAQAVSGAVDLVLRGLLHPSAPELDRP